MASSGSRSTVGRAVWLDKGVSAAAVHGLLALGVQYGSAFAYQPFPADQSNWLLLLALPFAQPSLLLMMLIVSASSLILRAGKPGAVVYFLAVTFLNVVLVADQLVFGRFFEHFGPDLLDFAISPWVFAMVVAADVGLATLASFVALALVSYYLFRILWRDDVPRFIGLDQLLRRPMVWFGVCVFVAVNAIAGRTLEFYLLNQQPLIAALRSWTEVEEAPWRLPRPANIFALRYGTPAGAEDRLTEYLRDPPLPLVSAAPRRIVLIDIGAVDLDSDVFVPVVRQQGGFNRLLAGGVLFDTFYHRRGEIMSRLGFEEVMPGYTVSALDLTQVQPTIRGCSSVAEVTAAVDRWWAEHVNPSSNAVVAMDLRSVAECEGITRLEFLSGVLAHIDGLNRQTGAIDQSVQIVIGHYEADSGAVAHLPATDLKGFVLAVFPERLGVALTSSRPSGSADLLQTLAVMAGRSLPAGRDMLSPTWKEQLMYFADGSPALERWALIDGEWLYSATAWGTEQALYHLDQEPTQGANLAEYFPNRMRLYDRLLGIWYARLGSRQRPPDPGFVEHGQQWWRPSDIDGPGPKLLRIGYLEVTRSVGQFSSGNRFNPREPIVVHLRVLPGGDPSNLAVEWVSPLGEVGRHVLTIDEQGAHIYLVPSFGLPMAAGSWQVFVKYVANNRTALAEEFWVDAEVPLQAVISPFAPRLAGIAAGYLADPLQSPDVAFSASTVLGVDQPPVVQLEWADQDDLSFVQYEWYSPNGRSYRGEHGIRTQWPRTWLLWDRRTPLLVGKWKLVVFDGERRLGETEFEIRP